eukprot:SM000012S25438  [mRNA]  locus=s12:1096641:1100924:+ [translate_table: standard]
MPDEGGAGTAAEFLRSRPPAKVWVRALVVASRCWRSTAAGLPPGAYTTTRTAGGAAVVLCWEAHMARLADSIARLPALFPGLPVGLLAPDALASAVMPSMQTALAIGRQTLPLGLELAVTILICSQATAMQHRKDLLNSVDVFVYSSRYRAHCPEGSCPPAVEVAVLGQGRLAPLAKCSTWATDRQLLEQAKPPGVAEIILSSNGNMLLEGLVTNLFIIVSCDITNAAKVAGCTTSSSVVVQTASLVDGVLPGVTRHLVLRSCHKAGIVVHERAPRWDQRHTWQGAFLSSAMQIVQPVQVVRMSNPWVAQVDASSCCPAELKWTEWQSPGVVGNLIERIKALTIGSAMEEGVAVDDFLSRDIRPGL